MEKASRIASHGHDPWRRAAPSGEPRNWPRSRPATGAMSKGMSSTARNAMTRTGMISHIRPPRRPGPRVSWGPQPQGFLDDCPLEAALLPDDEKRHQHELPGQACGEEQDQRLCESGGRVPSAGHDRRDHPRQGRHGHRCCDPDSDHAGQRELRDHRATSGRGTAEQCRLRCRARISGDSPVLRRWPPPTRQLRSTR